MGKRPVLAILGGDRREEVLAAELGEKGFTIKTWGFNCLPGGATGYASPQDAARAAEAVILPLAGIKEELTVPNLRGERWQLSKDFFQLLPTQTPVLVGRAPSGLRELAPHCRLIEVAEDAELTVLNSIPTAEGAIAIAMAESPVTLHGSETLVIGFGCCGMSLARMLKGIGAQVTVAARKPADRARAHEMGFTTCSFTDMAGLLGAKAYIFNTVPAPVLSRTVLTGAASCHVIVDIASGGGTDFLAAQDLGIKALLAPGLPGKAAPVTAGRILAQIYPRILQDYGLKGSGLR